MATGHPLVAVIGRYVAKEAEEVLSGVGRLQTFESVDELMASQAKPYAMFVWHIPTTKYNAEVLSQLPSLRLVIRMGVGYDNIDAEAAGRLGIAVCNLPAYGTEEVADSAMSHILNLYRRTLALIIDRRASRTSIPITAKDISEAGKGVTRMRGQKLGLIGLGPIGLAVCLRAKPFGFDVSFYDPYLPEGLDKALGIRRHRHLDALLTESDCISLHCPLTHQTRHLLGKDEFAKMKTGVRLVNTGRGAVVDEAALAGALVDGKVSSAALDVQEKEPFCWEDSPLAESPNVYCLPHVAWYSDQSIAEMWTMASEEAKRALIARQQGGDLTEHLRHCVNAKHWRVPGDTDDR